MPRSATRILIIEDHVLFAESLELALTVEGYDVRRVPVPTRPEPPGALLASIIRLKPRIVLLDLDLAPFGDGDGLITRIAAAGINVVVVTGSSDRSRWGGAIQYGARTVISKSRPLNEILSTVRRIAHGLPVLDHRDREEMIRYWQRKRGENQELLDRLERLTVRESEVLGELMLGHTVHAIAATRVVSEATVRTQVKAILAKLEVSSQLAAVGLAHEVEWRPPHSARH